jgi:molecular chaperone DnaJ
MGGMQFSQMGVCNACSGQGAKFQFPCTPCSSNGVVQKAGTLNISIPRGADNGTHLKVSNRGNVGPEGAGHLYVVTFIRGHSEFTRQGSELYIEVEVDYPDVVLGSVIQVSILSQGSKETRPLKVPAGTQYGDILILPEEGFPDVNAPKKRGGLHVGILVKIPRKAESSSEEVELLNKYRELLHKKKS